MREGLMRCNLILRNCIDPRRQYRQDIVLCVCLLVNSVDLVSMVVVVTKWWLCCTCAGPRRVTHAGGWHDVLALGARCSSKNGFLFCNIGRRMTAKVLCFSFHFAVG
jgi:hypothetical protein